MTDQATVEALEARAVAATQALLRMAVIEAKGLPIEAAHWLQGTTRAEIEDSADGLMQAIAEARLAKRKSTRRVHEADDSGPPPDVPPRPLKRGRQSALARRPQDPLLAEFERRFGKRGLWS